MRTKLLINGELVAGDGESLPILDPAMGNEIARVAEASREQVDAAVRSSAEAFESFSMTTPGERAALLLHMADLLEKDSRELAELESLDVGKPWPSDRGPYRGQAWRTSRAGAGGRRLNEHDRG